MRMWMDGFLITEQELRNIIDSLGINEVIELIDVDQDGDLYFEKSVYGTYY